MTSSPQIINEINNPRIFNSLLRTSS